MEQLKEHLKASEDEKATIRHQIKEMRHALGRRHSSSLSTREKLQLSGQGGALLQQGKTNFIGSLSTLDETLSTLRRGSRHSARNRSPPKKCDTERQLRQPSPPSPTNQRGASEVRLLPKMISHARTLSHVRSNSKTAFALNGKSSQVQLAPSTPRYSVEDGKRLILVDLANVETPELLVEEVEEVELAEKSELKLSSSTRSGLTP